ncbi:MAG TPA: hypothetical protein VKV02_13880 [Acidobacteriaceae bacterium]|nr:hypothetical protein [Acidobacteriaceae bacterium]
MIPEYVGNPGSWRAEATIPQVAVQATTDVGDCGLYADLQPWPKIRRKRVGLTYECYPNLPELPADHPWLAQTPWWNHHRRNRSLLENAIILARNIVFVLLAIAFLLTVVGIFVAVFGGFGDTNGAGVNRDPASPNYGKVEVAMFSRR